MIQTEIRNDRSELEKLDHHDPRYWQGTYKYEPYPKQLFKAGPGEKYQHPDLCVVQNQHEHNRLSSDWKEDPDAARAVFDQHEGAMAKASAEHNASVTKMSPKAQAEALAHDRSTDEMVADVPAPKKRGRPAKIVLPS